MQTLVLALFVLFFFSLVLLWEEKSRRTGFSVPLWVDKLNKPSITAHVHQSLPALLSVENFIHGLARRFLHEGRTNQGKAFHVRSCLCAHSNYSIPNVSQPNLHILTLSTCRETWSGFPVSVDLLSQIQELFTYSALTLPQLRDPWLIIYTSGSFFGHRVTFSLHNKRVNKKTHSLTSLLTSRPEIAARLN